MEGINRYAQVGNWLNIDKIKCIFEVTAWLCLSTIIGDLNENR